MPPSEPLSHLDIRWDLSSDDHIDSGGLDLEDVAIRALIEAQSYRLLAQQAIHLLHVNALELRNLRSRTSMLRAEIRRKHGPRPEPAEATRR